ncbi:MAG: HNH endonuclease signature motif containing protein [Candidatus Cloacimonadaceae bacterium]|nr:HNH endonuclease signature motif containing protein [Candidatus Cloacimonadaceae bacterium]MDP3113341.1 HNH endonuclease signature motif containing protein [Candidatus Cloacimonadaceae bacterium]
MKANGASFSEREIRDVWEKARYQSGFGTTEKRADVLGSIIQFDSYGDTSSLCGWEIDHIIPVQKGGTDLPGNLQPLHWKNNRRKGNAYPWICS